MEAVAISLEEVHVGEKGGANGVVWAKMAASYTCLKRVGACVAFNAWC
jgi:hypothetical protein